MSWVCWSPRSTARSKPRSRPTPALRSAVAFWEEQLHPLSALARAGRAACRSLEEDRGAARCDAASKRRKLVEPAGAVALGDRRLCRRGRGAAALYRARWLAGGAELRRDAAFAAAAGSDELYCDGWARGSHCPHGRRGCDPPTGRAYELWAIAPGATTPQAIGVIPENGVLRVASLPPDVRLGATLGDQRRAARRLARSAQAERAGGLRWRGGIALAI